MNIYLQCTFPFHVTCNQKKKKKKMVLPIFYVWYKHLGLILSSIPLPSKRAYGYIHPFAVLIHASTILPTCRNTRKSHKKAATNLLKPMPKQTQLMVANTLKQKFVLQSRTCKGTHSPGSPSLPKARQEHWEQTLAANTTFFIRRVSDDQRTCLFQNTPPTCSTCSATTQN